jgi:hypothetical protein
LMVCRDMNSWAPISDAVTWVVSTGRTRSSAAVSADAPGCWHRVPGTRASPRVDQLLLHQHNGNPHRQPLAQVQFHQARYAHGCRATLAPVPHRHWR